MPLLAQFQRPHCCAEMHDALRLEHAGWRNPQLKPIPDGDRAVHERLLAAVRLMPGSSNMQDFLFVGFVAVGGLAKWWLVCGLLINPAQ